MTVTQKRIEQIQAKVIAANEGGYYPDAGYEDDVWDLLAEVNRLENDAVQMVSIHELSEAIEHAEKVEAEREELKKKVKVLEHQMSRMVPQVVLTEMYHAEECKGNCCLCVFERALEPKGTDAKTEDCRYCDNEGFCEICC